VKQGPIERLLSHVRDFGLAGLHLRVLAGLNLYRELSIFALDLQHQRPGQKARISIAISETVPNEGLHRKPQWPNRLEAHKNGKCLPA
jgi:hypothetical protein